MLDKVQLRAVAEVIKNLDHYQILKVKPLAPESEIRDAFHKEALLFHPDQYFSEDDPEVAELANEIYTRLVSAYRELSNPNSRLSYDRKMNFPTTSEGVEEDDVDENAITSVKRKPSWARTGPGEKFFKLAEKAYSSRDLKSAISNLQIALSAEPDNEQYKKFKADLEAQLSKAPAKKA